MLWGLDAIKTRGESVAMALELVGARSRRSPWGGGASGWGNNPVPPMAYLEWSGYLGLVGLLGDAGDNSFNSRISGQRFLSHSKLKLIIIPSPCTLLFGVYEIGVYRIFRRNSSK